MGPAIGDILPLAIGVAISPVPIIAVILMLFSNRARSNSLAFLGGWIAGLTVVGIIVLLVSSGADVATENEPSTAASAFKVLLGVLLLLLGWRQWRSRPKEGEEPEMPGWMQSIESLKPAMALGLGALMSGVNPKNLMLALGAAVAIAQEGLSAGESSVALLIFIAIASCTVTGPVLLFFVLGERAEETLNGWKAWLTENNATVMAVLLLVLGVVLLGQGIGGLTD